MTGPDHDRKAEELTVKAHDYLGQGGAECRCLGRRRPDSRHSRPHRCYRARDDGRADGRAWTEVAGTEFSAGAP